MPIHTDRTIAANRPNIVLKNKDKTCLLIDITIPASKPTPQSKKNTVTLTKYWKSKLSERGALNNNRPSGYGSPWHHQEGHGEPLQQNPWHYQHT